MNKQVYFTDEIWKKLTEEAKKMSLSRSAYIRMVLLNFWQRGERNE